MKLLNNTLLSGLVVLLMACDPSLDNQSGNPDAELSFYITGINKSLSYTFSPGNGRVAQSVPDDVRNLTVVILNESEEVVYEQHYYQYGYYYEDEDSLNAAGFDYYYYENTIPDTLFIPSLGEGNYTVLTATADFFINHYYGDANNENGRAKIESWVTSEGPIYAGKAEIELTEDEQELVMGMKNISSKITIKKEGSNEMEGWLEIRLLTENNTEYSLLEEDFQAPEYDYNYDIYGYVGERPESHIFSLPKTLTGVEINYYDYSYQGVISQRVELNPSVALGVGDAITFTIDVDEVISGSGSGVFEWENIDWNDLGDINVP